MDNGNLFSLGKDCNPGLCKDSAYTPGIWHRIIVTARWVPTVK